MCTPALRVQELGFREGMTSYVHAICRRNRVKRANVEDLVQETMAQIMASIASYRPEQNDLEKWGRGVARNVVRRHLRDAKRYAERFSEYHSNMAEHPAHEPSPERCLQRKQARCRLSTVANELSERNAQVLMLYVVDEMSHKEIGAELEITEGASQKCFQRARDYLASCLVDDALCVLPPFETSCNDGSVSNDIASQWFDWGKWSHYTGQITATILAFVLFWPTNEPTKHHAYVAGTITTSSAYAMYRHDKPSVTPDKLDVVPDVTAGKPKPASLPRVQAVPGRTKVVGKPTPIRPLVPRSSYKHSVSSSVNRRSG